MNGSQANSQRLYDANSLCILLLGCGLSGAFYFQYVLNENPCPLCLLQRMGMIGVALALGMNTYLGFNRRHFSLAILAAVVGCGYSVRQVLLHIAPEPGEPLGYGTPLFGIHLYSWGVVIFVVCILGCAVLQFFSHDEPGAPSRNPSRFEIGVFYFLFLLCLANVISTFVMCGVGPCCENGPCP